MIPDARLIAIVANTSARLGHFNGEGAAGGFSVAMSAGGLTNPRLHSG